MLYIFGIVYASSIIGCLTSPSLTLDFVTSLVFGEAMYMSVCYNLCALTITAILRFISLVKNCETSGIQSLGPDDVAIWKIRIISIAITLTLPLIGLMFFQSIPGFFYSLYNQQNISPAQILSQDPSCYVLLVPLVVAVVANATPRIYSTLLVKKFHLLINSDEKFLITFENAVSFLIVIASQVLSAYMDRKCRLLVYYPIIIFLICDIFPFVIIMKNAQMTKLFKSEISSSYHVLVSLRSRIFNMIKKRNDVSPA